MRFKQPGLFLVQLYAKLAADKRDNLPNVHNHFVEVCASTKQITVPYTAYSIVNTVIIRQNI